MGKIEQINEAISRADRKESKLTDGVFQIGGYTSDRVRCLMNNLGAISTKYLEIGVHRGSTYVSACYDNEIDSVAIDNFSELDEDKSAKHDFINNCDRFGITYHLIQKDCFEVTDLPEDSFDLYLYDGNHSYESQKKALSHFIPFMKDEFILVVDDFNWDDVERGTIDGIKEIGAEILYDFHLNINGVPPEDGYWNGVGVFLLKKKKC